MSSFRLTDFRRRAREGSPLLGFADGVLILGDGVALELTDLALHRRNDRTWIGWPSKPLVDRDGVALRDEASGKIKYSAPLVRPVDRALAARIDGAIIAAVQRAHPDLFGEQARAHPDLLGVPEGTS